MLGPDHRRLYTDALRPPPGLRFGEAVATTYSLDLATLLTVPLHLALFSTERPLAELFDDGVALLEALRRTADRVTVYTQAARVLAPSLPHVLYGLLEPTVVEVAAPAAGGAFHPKLWLIRFDDPRGDAVRLRLLVLTRNVTDDRCWDLVLTLDGDPGGKARLDNRELSSLLSRLPDLAIRALPTSRAAATAALAELALCTEWVLPDGFEGLRFHALGLDGRRGWSPLPSDRLAVVSPFLAEAALESLLASTDHPLALVSRPEELARIDRGVLERFERVLVLADRAEVEDGEEGASAADGLPSYGLHAKAFVCKSGWDTHLYVGSANASNPALVHGTNVELVAELIGRGSQVGGVEDLVEGDGFGSVLTEWLAADDPAAPDAEVELARDDLEVARRAMLAAGLCLRFRQRDDGWGVELVGERPLPLAGIAAARAWLVTRLSTSAVPVDGLRDGDPSALPVSPLALLTSFVAFELTAARAEVSIRFVLGLEADGLPAAERDAAIVRDVIQNRDGFLRYVMLLLAEAEEDRDVFGHGSASWKPVHTRDAEDDLPLFEALTRAFCGQPERLATIRRLLRRGRRLRRRPGRARRVPRAVGRLRSGPRAGRGAPRMSLREFDLERTFSAASRTSSAGPSTTCSGACGSTIRRRPASSSPTRSVWARRLSPAGIIARTLHHLREDVRRIDIVYVCSNAAIAQQNVNRLNVMSDEHLRWPPG